MKTVLLVEDDALVAKLVARGLERAGCSVEHVASGREALGRLTSARYDAAVVDLGLPDLDGGDVARLLRSHEVERGLRPMIFVLSSAREIGPSDPVRVLVSAVVPKPVSIPALVRLLSDLERHAPKASA